MFSLEVHAGGTRFIGEMGAAPYGTSPGRNFDQTTAAHSTLTVDGQEQASIMNEWRWSTHVIPAVRRWISTETHDFFHGIHEGYYRSCATLHARKIFFMKSAPSYWAVLDWLESEREHDYQVYFHGCEPGAIDGTSILFGTPGDRRLAVIPPEDERLSLRHEQNDGLTAYLTEKSLDAERHPCFAYSKHAASDCLAWVLMPCNAGTPLPRIRRLPVRINGLEEDAHGATAISIAFPQHTDVICISHKDFDSEMAYGDYQSWGWFSFRRIARDGVVTLTIEHRMADGVCGR